MDTVRTCSTWATLRPKMFGVGDFWLKTTIIIKIESHPFYLTYPRFETTRLSCFQSRQIFHEIHETGQHYNHPPQTFLAQVYVLTYVIQWGSKSFSRCIFIFIVIIIILFMLIVYEILFHLRKKWRNKKYWKFKGIRIQMRNQKDLDPILSSSCVVYKCCWKITWPLKIDFISWTFQIFKDDIIMIAEHERSKGC